VPSAPEEAEIPIAFGAEPLGAQLTLPVAARGMVVFAHGSGSSRHSPRNRHVAEQLHRHGLATLLVDLLCGDEAEDRARVFDIELLAQRLSAVTAWVAAQPAAAGLPIGWFGASTGAAAALGLAGRHPDVVRAVVSRGGRPDLTPDALLAAVRAPTLLIVGGADEAVLDMNRRAMARMRAPAELEVVPGASHLFEEPGALERVADLAGGWFVRHLAPSGGDTHVGV
jgi:putative phosphoribosyl transferase